MKVDLSAYATPGRYKKYLEDIVYSNSFKRLAHKSQVIIKPTRDHFRSRLIHTEEVNQIALSLGTELGLNNELVSAIAMAHDLGHTPFGHAGERTLQNIIKRELAARFGLNLKDDRSIFHHSSNSARILLKELDKIPSEIIDGVLKHSWSPWKEKQSPTDIPITYEGQVVAVADQIASINHDTEDIIEGATYTNYDCNRFRQCIVIEFKEKHPKIYESMEKDINTFIEDKTIHPGYGRENRVEVFIQQIVNETGKHSGDNDIKGSPRALKHPIAITDPWSKFLNFYELFIRESIIQKESWFIGRDAMAEALVSTVFNHIWPNFRKGWSQVRMELYPKEEIAKSKTKPISKYLEHFLDFYQDHYRNDKSHKDYYQEYFVKAKNSGIWDINIMNAFSKKSKKEKTENYEPLSNLISVIDFITGLTDRYCLEIFDNVYHDFII